VRIQPTNSVLFVSLIVLAVLAVLIALIFDSPTSVILLVVIAVAASVVSFWYGMRADRRGPSSNHGQPGSARR